MHTVQQIVAFKTNRSVQETKRTMQEAYRTVQETNRTVQEAYRTVQEAYRIVQERKRTESYCASGVVARFRVCTCIYVKLTKMVVHVIHF